MAELMERPTFDQRRGRSKRALVRYWRECSAYDMASYKGAVTREEYDKAYKLLNRCKNWAIAQMRFDESETAENYNSLYRRREGAKLDMRYARLNAELEPYGCAIHCHGYTCQNVYRTDDQGRTYGGALLHYFD